MDIFWLFFMLSALQPVIKQRLLEASRRRLIGLIERERKSRLVLLVHRQETMSLLGFPLFRYIDINDSEEILRAVHLTDPEIPLDLVLHTPGGLVLAATQIARAVSGRKGKVTVFVPHYAMSGGTLIALAADDIVMCEHAVLGPVDPQLGEYPAASILKAARQKPIAEVDDKTLILADQAEKALIQMQHEVGELLARKYPAERAAELARLLSSGTWTHDYPITYARARELGLRVSSGMPEIYCA
jgi:ClpP class serine protease